MFKLLCKIINILKNLFLTLFIFSVLPHTEQVKESYIRNKIIGGNVLWNAFFKLVLRFKFRHRPVDYVILIQTEKYCGHF